MDLLKSLGFEGGKDADENAVFVAIYPDAPQYSPLSSGHSADGSSNMDPVVDLEAVTALCTQAIMPHVQGYIWQRDALQFTPSSKQLPPWASTKHKDKAKRDADADTKGAKLASRAPATSDTNTSSSTLADGPACIWSVVRFGDNIEDEWFVTFLLMEVSRRVPHVSIQVWDNDGDFLLIEAAYVLPRWLKPETARYRVWLRGGALHVIPLPPSPALPGLPAQPNLHQALDIVASGRVPRSLSARVQRPIDERLSGYPAAAARAMHLARAVLPARLAYALQRAPQLVAHAVECFYHRDPDDMRIVAKARHFPPSQTDLVPSAVHMSRCQYAQLAQQRFEPPKAWAACMPAACSTDASSPEAKAVDLGMKLTAGFEILCTHARVKLTGPLVDAADAAAAGEVHQPAASSSSGSNYQIITTNSLSFQHPILPPQQLEEKVLEADVASNPAWCTFKAALERVGYFGDSLDGSVRYRSLMATALRDFVRSDAYTHSAQAMAAPAELLAALLKEAAPQALAPQAFPDPGPCDSDQWMDEQSGVVDHALAAHEAAQGERQVKRTAHKQRQSGGAAVVGSGGSKGSADGVRNDKAMEVDAEAVSNTLRSFLEHMAGSEGAEVPKASSTTSTTNSIAKHSAMGPAAGLAKGNPASSFTRGPNAGGTSAFDLSSFMSVLKGVLGEGGGDGAAGTRLRDSSAAGASPASTCDAQVSNEEGEEADDFSTSSDEGSSFFSESDEEEEGEDEESDVDGQENTEAADDQALSRIRGSGQPSTSHRDGQSGQTAHASTGSSAGIVSSSGALSPAPGSNGVSALRRGFLGSAASRPAFNASVSHAVGSAAVGQAATMAVSHPRSTVPSTLPRTSLGKHLGGLGTSPLIQVLPDKADSSRRVQEASGPASNGLQDQASPTLSCTSLGQQNGQAASCSAHTRMVMDAILAGVDERVLQLTRSAKDVDNSAAFGSFGKGQGGLGNMRRSSISQQGSRAAVDFRDGVSDSGSAADAAASRALHALQVNERAALARSAKGPPATHTMLQHVWARRAAADSDDDDDDGQEVIQALVKGTSPRHMANPSLPEPVEDLETSGLVNPQRSTSYVRRPVRRPIGMASMVSVEGQEALMGTSSSPAATVASKQAQLEDGGKAAAGSGSTGTPGASRAEAWEDREASAPHVPAATAAVATAGAGLTRARVAAAHPSAAPEAVVEEEKEEEGEEGSEAAEDFLDAYSAVLDAELAGTKMGQSFDRYTGRDAPTGSAASSSGSTAAAGVLNSAPAAGAFIRDKNTCATPLQPVDLDMNLVKSLLQSLGAQQGLPGPAGNLAGLLGMKLPAGELQE